MFTRTVATFVLAIGCIDLSGLSTAHAVCTLPHSFTNGQTTDAPQIMDNFTALLACINGAGPAGATNSVQYNAGGGAYGGITPLTNGQLLIGSAGAAPQPATITAGPGINVTNGPGSVTISIVGSGGLFSQVMSSTPTSAATGLTTWLNQGSATVTDSAVGISLYLPASSSENIRGRIMAAPATPYRYTVLIANTGSFGNPFDDCGIGWYDGLSKFQILNIQTNNASNSTTNGVTQLYIGQYPSTTAFDSFAHIFNGHNNVGAQPNFQWFKIRDDGTNVYFMWSADGVNFQTLFSSAKSGGYLGATGYAYPGIFGDNGDNNGHYCTVMSWSQGS